MLNTPKDATQATSETYKAKELLHIMKRNPHVTNGTELQSIQFTRLNLIPNNSYTGEKGTVTHADKTDVKQKCTTREPLIPSHTRRSKSEQTKTHARPHG
ncbi:hypothetical protein TRVL_09342 [Trypanosoma vivax]|nr:hypothetical protein TRVL_09342 [Trypanosoma vivax]